MRRGVSVAAAGAVATWSLIFAAIFASSALVSILIIVGLVAGCAFISAVLRSDP